MDSLIVPVEIFLLIVEELDDSSAVAMGNTSKEVRWCIGTKYMKSKQKIINNQRSLLRPSYTIETSPITVDGYDIDSYSYYELKEFPKITLPQDMPDLDENGNIITENFFSNNEWSKVQKMDDDVRIGTAVDSFRSVLHLIVKSNINFRYTSFLFRPFEDDLQKLTDEITNRSILDMLI